MRNPAWALVAVVVVVFGIAYFERRPTLRDFDPVKHADFKDTWDKRVHLTYWEKWGGFEGEAAAKMAEAFNRCQDEIFVHYIQTSQVDRKALLATIGSNPPDIIGFWEQNVPQFAEGGALMQLDDLMKESGLKPEEYFPRYLELGRYESKIYALPSSPATMALFYNKEHFRQKADKLREAGLDPERAPRSIEELDKYAAVLNEFNEDGSPKIMGFLPTEPGWWNYAWGSYFGGKLYDPETGKLTLDTPENVEAYVWVKRYAEKYGAERLLRFRNAFGTYDSPYNAFIDGKVSMEIQGVWFPNFIRRHRPHMEFAVAPFPAPQKLIDESLKANPGSKPEDNKWIRSQMEADMLALAKSCQHPKEAWKYLLFTQKITKQHLTGQPEKEVLPGLVTMCKLQGKHMPITLRPEEFISGHPNKELAVFEALAASPHSFIAPRLTVWTEYRDQINRAFEAVWAWKAPAEPLRGLEGEARQQKVDELCREKIHQAFKEVQETMQKKLDQQRELKVRRGEAPAK